MPLNPDKIMQYRFPTVRHTYTEKDCILYALGIGMGKDPLDPESLPFVYEEGLKVVPSLAVVLAHPGFWAKLPEIGLDWVRLLQSSQEIIIHSPLPPAATVEATARFTEISDMGERMGAYIVTERTVRDVETGVDYCTLVTSILARGDGGFGGKRRSVSRGDLIPDREPDAVCDLATLPQQALLYRLSGDLNPLHASPAIAREAGFKAPILHGLCTLGVLMHALLKTCCDYDPTRIEHLRLRFSSPVYPGETIRTQIWHESERIAFRCLSLEQNKVVINNGYLGLGIGESTNARGIG